jgi:hypothetical protein
VTRFDDPAYVDAWAQRRRFPLIHHGIVSTVRTEVDPDGETVLDLCSSTGLLGRQLVDVGHYRVVALEQPGPALDRGRQAGVYDGIPVLAMRLEPDTVDEFLTWLGVEQVTTVVARRCFPELHDAFGDEFGAFAAGLAQSGVRRIVLEGRIASSRSVHALGTVTCEVDALAPHWKGRARGPFAVLDLNNQTA